MTLLIINILLSFLILLVIAYKCFFKIKVVDAFIEKHHIPIIPITVIAYVILVFVIIASDSWWENKYWIPIDATVINIEKRTDKQTWVNEHGIKETWNESTSYSIDYEFIYDGKKYQTTQSSQTAENVGDVKSIKINPSNPQNSDTPPKMLSMYLIGLSGWIIIFKGIITIMRKLFKK